MLAQQSAVFSNTVAKEYSSSAGVFPISTEDDFSKNAKLNIALAALYFFSGKLAFLIAVSFKSVTSAIFFPEGFALVFIILYGKRILPGVFLGQLTLGLSNDLNLSTSLAFSAGNCFELFLAAYFLKKYGFKKEELTLRNYLFIVFLIAIVLQPISAGLGCLSMWTLENHQPEALLDTFKYWWFGNFMGQALIVSVFWSITTVNKKHGLRKALQIPFLATFIFGAIFSVLFLYLGDNKTFQSADSFFIVSPFLIIIAYRFEFIGTSLSSLIIALIAQIYTAKGLGPFYSGNVQEGLISLNQFLLNITLSSGLLGVLFYERNKSENKLRENQVHLEKLVDRLHRNTVELERSNQALMDFTHIASHDLQEPLRKMIMFGGHLNSNYSQVLDEKGVDYLNRIQKSAQRMKVFIKDLLKLSEVNIKPKNTQLISLDAVISDVLSDLELSIKEKQGEVICGPLPKIQSDRLQMQQLFQNLLSNALKFQVNGRSPVINISSKKVGSGYWQVLIQDNGIGIDPKYAERIFQPFERLHGRSTYEGTGIGLAICQKTIKRHHGTITVKSEIDKGSCFILTLPESQPEENETNLLYEV
jgi:signal transduction histidine kinase